MAYKTITVGELSELLKQFPDDAPVFASWEGILVGVCEYRITLVNKINKSFPGGVVFDVNDYPGA